MNRTWEDMGMCVKCEAEDLASHGRHMLHWVEVTRQGGGWLEASCWRCGFTWQVEAADQNE
jgi:hypothetical protein